MRERERLLPPGLPIHTAYSETDSLLNFYRVTNTLGFHVQIDEQYSEEGEPYSYYANISISPSEQDEISFLLRKVSKTRAGNILLSVGGMGAAPEHIRMLIENDQNYHWEGTSHLNSTPKLHPRILEEAFLTAYEAVNGYRTEGNNNPQMDKLYKDLTGKGAKALTPETMGYVFAKTIKYVKRQDQIRQTRSGPR